MVESVALINALGLLVRTRIRIVAGHRMLRKAVRHIVRERRRLAVAVGLIVGTGTGEVLVLACLVTIDSLLHLVHVLVLRTHVSMIRVRSRRMRSITVLLLGELVRELRRRRMWGALISYSSCNVM